MLAVGADMEEGAATATGAMEGTNRCGAREVGYDVGGSGGDCEAV